MARVPVGNGFSEHIGTAPRSSSGSGGFATATITPNGNDQTVQLQSTINALAPGETLLIHAAAQPLTVTDVITIAQPISVVGEGALPAYDSYTTGLNTQALEVLPLNAPFIRGSVINQVTAAKDAIHVTAAAAAVNLRDLGILFGTSGDGVIMQNTGHGIVCSPPAYSGFQDQGILGSRWDNVIVYGHDGNHYAYKIINPEYCTFGHLQSFGGGGLLVDSNTVTGGFFGNSVFTHPYFVLCAAGSAHAVNFGITQPTGLSTFVCPQVWHYAVPGAIAGLASLAGPANTQLVWKEGGGGQPAGGYNTLVAPDFESNVAGASASILGAVVGNVFGEDVAVGTVQLATVPLPAINQSVTFYTDTSPQIVAQAQDGTQLYYVKLDKNNPGVYIKGIIGSVDNNAGVTLTPQSAMGTSPPTATVARAAFNRGQITFGTGTAPGTGRLMAVNLPTTGAVTPAVTLTAANAATAALGLYVETFSWGFYVGCQNAPAASQIATTYSLNYVGLA